jgi:NADH-quinone oxidoreductase subunit D
MKESAEFQKELHTDHMVVNMGPSHPATHGTVKFVLTLDGETVVNMDVEIGYLHRAFEKQCENGTWEQAFPYTDRLNYNSAILNNIAYALAVEKLCDIQIPERSKYLRTVTGELSRMADHYTNVGAAALELGAFTAFLYFVEARDLIWDILEKCCGARLTSNYIRIGGVTADLPDGIQDQIHKAFEHNRKLWVDVNKLLTKNRIFMDRMAGVGGISQEDAIEWGFTGPCLRACGVPYDVRKAHPYLAYDRVDFDIPIGSTGDNYDRYLVRMEELNQSMRIVEQALKDIPDGPVNVENPYFRRPSKDDVYSDMESLIFQFKTVIEGLYIPKGEVYYPTEGGNGEMGFYLVSDGTGKPVKCRVRPPCFALTSAMPLLVRGSLIADIIPTFDMINMIGGECDR